MWFVAGVRSVRGKKKKKKKEENLKADNPELFFVQKEEKGSEEHRDARLCAIEKRGGDVNRKTTKRQPRRKAKKRAEKKPPMKTLKIKVLKVLKEHSPGMHLKSLLR